jgi:DNA-directed RNA polymerase specialized sigma24 family protein
MQGGFLMLDIPTLNTLDNLMAHTLYRQEVFRLPELLTLSQEQQHVLVERARQQDEQAREALILGCLGYVFRKATFLYSIRPLPHDELLDLVQVGSLEMVEHLDQALATVDPVKYLCGIAHRHIKIYCTYRGALVNWPIYYTKAQIMSTDPMRVESLNMPLYDNHHRRLCVEQIKEAPEGNTLDESSQRWRFALLYAAVKRLPRRMRAVVVRHYGLFGQPTEERSAIGRYGTVEMAEREARTKLRAMLGETWTTMLSSSQRTANEPASS